jgi:hypothetical protein
MTVLSIDSGNIHTNKKFAATGLITDATMNPLFCEFWGEWGAHPGGGGSTPAAAAAAAATEEAHRLPRGLSWSQQQ